MPLADDVDLSILGERTDGYTGADPENLARRAGLQALRTGTDVKHIPMRFFEEALQETRASVTPEMEKEYRRMVQDLKQENPRGRQGFGFAVPQDANGQQRQSSTTE
jgi:transitional endoplasmic reticulum ATPase